MDVERKALLRIPLNPFQELKIQDSIRLKDRFNGLDSNPNISTSDKEFFKKLIPKVQFSIRVDLISSGLTAKAIEEVLVERETLRLDKKPKSRISK